MFPLDGCIQLGSQNPGIFMMNLRQRDDVSETEVRWWEANRTVWCEMEGGECVTALGRQNPATFSSCSPIQSGGMLTKRKKIDQELSSPFCHLFSD